MRNRFRIDYSGSGVQYTPAYAGTIAGAIKLARKKGWAEAYVSRSVDMRPTRATISERVGDGWEKVATVLPYEIVSVDFSARASTKQATQQIEQARKVLDENRRVMITLDGIAAKEHAEANKGKG